MARDHKLCLGNTMLILAWTAAFTPFERGGQDHAASFLLSLLGAHVRVGSKARVAALRSDIR
jgi:hypothetical protein